MAVCILFNQGKQFMWFYLFRVFLLSNLLRTIYIYIVLSYTVIWLFALSLYIYIVYTEICNILIAEKVLSVLLQFSTSYLCDLGFSTLNNIKSKKWEWLLSTEEEMKVCLSHIQPNTEEIVKKHQAQVSH